jgi:hypothetical protein
MVRSRDREVGPAQAHQKWHICLPTDQGGCVAASILIFVIRYQPLNSMRRFNQPTVSGRNAKRGGTSGMVKSNVR